MKKWLVTGASGFLGSNAAFFLQGKANGVGLARSSKKSIFPRTIECDFSNYASLKNAIHIANPDVILHTAALSSHESCESNKILARQVNADLTGTLSGIASQLNARFIYVSTDAVFDGLKGRYAETDTPNPFSIYGETKLLGEQFASEANPSSLIIRTNFFGWSPSQQRSILEFFVTSMRQNKQIQGYENFLVSTLYAQDLLTAIWQLNEQNISGIVHVGSSDELSKFDFGLSVADIFGLQSKLIQRVAAPITMGISRNRNLSLDTSNYCEITKAQLPSQREGILKAFQFESTLLDFFSEPLLSSPGIDSSHGQKAIEH